MKKRTNKKLALNKQKISELSGGNMRGVKGGFLITGGICQTFNLACVGGSKEDSCYCGETEDDLASCFASCIRCL